MQKSAVNLGKELSLGFFLFLRDLRRLLIGPAEFTILVGTMFLIAAT